MVAHPGEQGDTRSARRLNEPCRALVVEREGLPAAVDRVPVQQVREEWRVSDRWWTEEPLERRYFELVLESGRNVVVFRDERAGAWYRQQA